MKLGLWIAVLFAITGFNSEAVAAKKKNSVSAERSELERQDKRKVNASFDAQAWVIAGKEAGALEGFNERNGELKKDLDLRAASLDGAFRFDLLLIDERVLPPVVVMVEAERVLAPDGRLREAGRVYRVIAPAKLVTAAPVWRSFFYEAELEDSYPLVIPARGREAYESAKADGKKIGRLQADSLFAAQLGELTQTYWGMLKFMELEKQGMITAPTLQKTDRGIVRDDARLSIDDVLFELTAGVEFTDAKSWNAAIQSIRNRRVR